MLGEVKLQDHANDSHQYSIIFNAPKTGSGLIDSDFRRKGVTGKQ
jgi:hypothetical protein